MANPVVDQGGQAPPTDWTAQLLTAVSAHHPHVDGLTARRWAAALPSGYVGTIAPTDAAADLAAVQALGTTTPALATRLRRSSTPGPARRFLLYHRGPALPLSDLLPMLESFGFTVVDERPFQLPTTDQAGSVQLHDLGVSHPTFDEASTSSSPPGRIDLLAEAVVATWRGHAEVDRLNQLVLGAGLPWPQVAVLRAYRRYRRQVGTAFSADYLDRALVEHPDVARALIEYFAARLTPRTTDGPPPCLRPEGEVREEAVRLIDGVEDLDADRILRDLLALVDATVRTNLWARRSPRDPIALKFVSRAVPGMPDPVPYREIFVSGPRVEGVHLRGGPVARGGIRWSTRREDYRTEVLALLKAQLVKNAVIVPTGAKGGFVLGAESPAGAEEDRTGSATERAYRSFIGALLDLTDTVDADGSPRTPPEVHPLDGPDPYLVVAADRGTATFSDAANALATDRAFWLGDAFASGGRSGYDHKELGVTARGAWQAAREHFAALGVDPDTDPVTASGIGDMSGDVFGNGMLQSRTLRLVAAFDHRHVFLDPDPDPAVAYGERDRLFALPNSSWADYDPERISDGGGVWPRTDKRIPVSPAARRALALAEDVMELSGPELVSAVLAAPVDLLYAGGVGTYVKSTRESHADAADRGNDAVRIDAARLRARVVVEGANLALTQAARVEYATAGGAINIDAVDNAAGVDTSDHEVNLKVLLALPVADGVLTLAGRDEILSAQRGWVVDDVLRHVRQQTAALTREDAAGADRLAAYGELLEALEQETSWPHIDRRRDALPTPRELDRMARDRRGLVRPQLAVLMGVVKSNLRRELTAAVLHDRDPFHQVLCGYFPEPVHRDYGRWLHDRRLNRELAAALVASRLANDVVERMGTTWVHQVAADLGVSPVLVVQGCWTARLVLNAGPLWAELDEVGEQSRQRGSRLQALDNARDHIRRSVAEAARRYAARSDLDSAEAVRADRPVFEALVAAALFDTGPLPAHFEHQTHELRNRGLPAETAARAAAVAVSGGIADIAHVSRSTGAPPATTAALFGELDNALDLNELEAALRRHHAAARSWERREIQGLRSDWRDLRVHCARSLLIEHDTWRKEDVDRWLHDRLADAAGRGPAAAPETLADLPVAGLAVHLRTLRRRLAAIGPADGLPGPTRPVPAASWQQDGGGSR